LPHAILQGVTSGDVWQNEFRAGAIKESCSSRNRLLIWLGENGGSENIGHDQIFSAVADSIDIFLLGIKAVPK
jgi:hypothetical protein